MDELETHECALDGGCGARIIWAKTENGKWMPLNLDPVPAGTKNARVLIGNMCFGRVSAVEKIAQMFDCDDAQAYERVMNEYLWYTTHLADHRAGRARVPQQRSEASR